MFKYKLKDVPIKFGSRTILHEALKVFEKLFGEVNAKPIKDYYGTIAFQIGNIFLTGKKEPYGNPENHRAFVSVHKQIWDEALKTGRKIVIYIQLTGYFYRFSPDEIQETTINDRGGQPMVNFDIREGKNLLKLVAYKRKIERVAEKNRQYFQKEMGPKTREEKDKEFLKAGAFG